MADVLLLVLIYMLIAGLLFL